MTPLQRWLLRTLLMALFVLLLILLFPAHVSGQQPDARDLVASAKQLQLNLQYDEAQKLLQPYLETHPDDLRALNLLATVILYREMFDRGLLESQLYGKKGDIFKPKQEPLTEEFQKQLTTVLDKTDSLAEERLKKDPKDKDALYWTGVARGTRATFLFTLKRSYLGALGQAKQATRLHRDLTQLDSAYIDALLVVGVNEYVVGSLPWIVKAMAALAGAHGDKAGGLEKVERVGRSGNYAREDAKFLLDVLYQREKRPRDALPIVQELARSYPGNFLLQIELAAIYRDLNDWRRAADTYNTLLAKYRLGESPRLPAPKVLYFAGQAHENLHEPEQALSLYEEAGKLPGDNPYVPRAQQAAAELLKKMKQSEPRK